MLEKALVARPGVAEYVASRCDLLVNWGNLDVEQGRLDAGIARFGQGLRELDPILNAEPNLLRLKATALNLHGARALALEKAGRFREASDDWGRVIALDEPGPVVTGHTISRLLCLARGGDHRAVATEAIPLEDAGRPFSRSTSTTSPAPSRSRRRPPLRILPSGRDCGAWPSRRSSRPSPKTPASAIRHAMTPTFCLSPTTRRSARHSTARNEMRDPSGV